MMSVDQVRKFVEMSVDQRIVWEQIAVLGGEPTLNPQLPQIVEVLLEFKRRHSANTRIVLVTNGYGQHTAGVLGQLSQEIEIKNTAKQFSATDSERFHYFNLAPLDSPFYRYSDFTNACEVAFDCGMGLTPFGYYPCAIAGGIDRVFGFDLGRKTFPAHDDRMREELRTFCGLCGLFGCNTKIPMLKRHLQERRSKRWRTAYERYLESVPTLTRY